MMMMMMTTTVIYPCSAYRNTRTSSSYFTPFPCNITLCCAAVFYSFQMVQHARKVSRPFPPVLFLFPRVLDAPCSS